MRGGNGGSLLLQREELELQRKELEQSRELVGQQVEEMRKGTQFREQEVKAEEAKAQPILAFQYRGKEGTKLTFGVRNFGAMVSDCKIEHRSTGLSVRFPDDGILRIGKAITGTVELDDTLSEGLIRLSYVDTAGTRRYQNWGYCGDARSWDLIAEGHAEEPQGEQQE